MSKKFFISGGGTGGHFYPALSVAEKFHKEQFEPVLIGAKKGIEGKKDFPFGEKKLFDMDYVVGKSFINKMKSSYLLMESVFKIISEIKKEKPLFSICFGGYTSLPLGIASAITRTPLYIHEQNSYPSNTNILLSKLAKKVFITFPFTQKLNGKNVIHTGIPIRESVLNKINLSREKAREILNIPDKKHILVIGGSQGAKKLNETTIKLAENMPEYFFTLIYGKRELPENIPENLKAIPFSDDVGTLYSSSDFIISRAGSGTINELMAFGKYALYVPYPYAASNHQYFNAKWLKDKGLSDIVLDSELTPQVAKEKINQYFLKSEEEKEKIKKELKSLVKLNSSDIIYENIVKDIQC